MRHLKFLSIFLAAALVAAGALFYAGRTPADETEKPAVFPEKTIVVPASSSAPPNLKLHARYAGVMDASSGRMLYGREMDKRAAMASTTKIMTALLVLESGRTGETVTASSYAASMPKVHLGMVKGRRYRLKDLLYSLMLESHNDTAVAIAEHMAGSVQGFAAKMNEKAKALGMSSTHFVTPNGLDAKGHASTPADMCRLAAYAIKNKDFCALIRTKSYHFTDLSGKHSYSLNNRDAFLSYYDGALGIKTGFTGDAGYCFVGAARRDGVTLTSCVLACGWPPNKSYKWTDTKALMDYGFSHYTAFTFPVQNLSALRIPVEEGRADYVSCSQPAAPSTLLGQHETVTVRYSLPDKLYAPVRSGTAIGSVSFYINDALYRTEKIFPSENIEKSDFSDTIKTVLHLWTETFTGAM